MSGYVLYRGPSLLDGSPIVAIATTDSRNRKTGDMIQVWILAADMAPTDAVHAGLDAGVCGDCTLRGTTEGGRNRGRSCYVRVFHGPLAVWKAWRRGNYSEPALHWLADLASGRQVRLGAYGDPAAVPRAVWDRLLTYAAGWTGYTHQWRTGLAMADLCMASVETDADAAEARELGYRVFHVTQGAEPKRDGYMVCPASAEAGHRLTCDACGSCSGMGQGATADVQIAAHGSGRVYLPTVAA